MNSLGCKSGRDSRLRAGALVGVLGMLGVLLSPSALSQPGDAADNAGAMPEVTAQWESYDLPFHYFGFSTYYTCDGLEERLEQILRQVGAHPDVQVRASGCFGFNDVSKWQTARVRVRMPATPVQAATESFAVTSKLVNLRTQGISGSGSGSCELLEQVRDQLLPALKIQLVKDGLHCVPGQSSTIGQSLQVQALIAANGK